MRIYQADISHIRTLAELAVLLWPEHTREELEEEFKELIRREDAVFFLADDAGATIGFAQCQLRHDYVEGTGTSPVGYLEAIYVADSCRRKGIARELLAACEDWAGSMGCLEFASDCELNNMQSLRFHLGTGFKEAGRIICFVKTL